MFRADKARGKSQEDIPLARRIRPFWSSKSKNSSTLIAGFLLSFISFLILLTGLSKVINLSQLAVLDRSNKANPKSLLGHYPYPEATKDELADFYPGFKVHIQMLNALSQMKKAAAREGIDLVLLSGFRSVELQREIFYSNKSIRNQIAIERAKVSAPPGYSEHSTGYAIDLGDAKRPETHFEVEFADTDSFRWLRKNAPKYHFVLSFPEGNKQGVSYEPWHWRFEGNVEALKKFEPANKILSSK